MVYLAAVAVLLGICVGITLLLLLASHFMCNYGPCKVTINGKESFTVKGGCKLLEALYDHQIFIPSACGGQGTCGFCKVCVRQGGGPLLPTEEPFISPQEAADGMRLACQVKVRESIELEVKPEYLEVKQFEGKVVSSHLVAPDIREIHIGLPVGVTMPFEPGQYVQVQVPNKKETVFRAYSLASVPSAQSEIELLVRRLEGGLGSTYLHGLKPEDPLVFTGPYGDFQLNPDPQVSLICVGGGVGMAPMRSLLRHIAETCPAKECWLFFGARTDDQLLYRQAFEALSLTMPHFHVCYALSEPESCPAWKGATGFIHESVQKLLPPIGQGKSQAFLCGPPQMLTAARGVLLGKGLTEDDIFADEF